MLQRSYSHWWNEKTRHSGYLSKDLMTESVRGCAAEKAEVLRWGARFHVRLLGLNRDGCPTITGLHHDSRGGQVL